MKYRIVNIGDIHLEENTDPVLTQLDCLASAITSGVTADASLILVLNGDFAYSGQKEQFVIAKELVNTLKEAITNQLPSNSLTIALMPGNHDCDFSDDQAARTELLKELQPKCPPPSIEKVVLQPLSKYFDFVCEVGLEDTSISRDFPYLRRLEIGSGTDRLTLTLLNSAWMSERRERANTLKFPLELLTSTTDNTDYLASVVAMHHPLNWFRQPDTMRQLGDWLAGSADVLLTGHEHFSTAVQRNDGDHRLLHLEGGALQESPHVEASSFHILDIEGDNKAEHRVFKWSVDHYKSSEPNHMESIQNSGSSCHSNSFRSSFISKLVTCPEW